MTVCGPSQIKKVRQGSASVETRTVWTFLWRFYFRHITVGKICTLGLIRGVVIVVVEI